jgi:hypothetical protein
LGGKVAIIVYYYISEFLSDFLHEARDIFPEAQPREI